MSRFRKTFRRLVIAGGILLFLAAAGVWYLVANVDGLARAGLERTLEVVLQVEVAVGAVDVDLNAGSVTVDGLTIGNPDGFQTAEAMRFDHIAARVDIGSFRTERYHVPEILISGGKLTLEQGRDGSNLSVIQRSAARFAGREGKAEPPAAKADKHIVIDHLVLENLKVGVSATAMRGQDLTFPLPRIDMHDLGAEEPTTVAEAIREVLGEILRETVAAGAGVLPVGLTQSLRDALQAGAESGRSLGGALKRVGESAGGLLRDRKEAE